MPVEGASLLRLGAGSLFFLDKQKICVIVNVQAEWLT